MPFDDILEKIEDLGSKRPVQVRKKFIVYNFTFDMIFFQVELSKMRYGEKEETPITAETVDDVEQDNLGDKAVDIFGHESSQPVEKVRKFFIVTVFYSLA